MTVIFLVFFMLYFFYGEEDFLVDLEVKKIKEDFLGKKLNESNLGVFDFGEETNLENLIDNFSEQSLFSEQKMIIVRDFFSNTKADEQNELLGILKKNDWNDWIVFSEKGLPKKNGRLFKWLEENAKTKEFTKLEEKKLLDWIKNRTNELEPKVSISEKVARELAFLTSGDLRKIEIELNKLVNYVSAGEVSLVDLKKLVAGKVEANIFQTIELAFRNDKKKSLFLLKQQLAKGDDPFYIFSMYVYQIRVFLKIAGFLEKQKNATEFVIAKETKLNPFVVKKSLFLIRNFPFKKLLKAHRNLLNSDKEIKLGKKNIESALDLFVMEV